MTEIGLSKLVGHHRAIPALDRRDMSNFLVLAIAPSKKREGPLSTGIALASWFLGINSIRAE